MKLTDYERSSALWHRIRDEIDDRLETLRQRNDGDLDPIETARLRGAISTWKELQHWAEKDPTIFE